MGEGSLRRVSERGFGGYDEGSPTSMSLGFCFFDVFFVDFAPHSRYLQLERLFFCVIFWPRVVVPFPLSKKGNRLKTRFRPPSFSSHAARERGGGCKNMSMVCYIHVLEV